jgi:hypothetical protein
MVQSRLNLFAGNRFCSSPEKQFDLQQALHDRAKNFGDIWTLCLKNWIVSRPGWVN